MRNRSLGGTLDEYMRFYAELVGVLLSNIIINIEGVHSYAQERFRRYT